LPSSSDKLRVVLVRTRNPLNLGAAARAMSNFGFLHLRVVQPYHLAFREARSAVGAASILKKAEEYSTVAEAVADCSLVVGTTTLRNRKRQHSMRRLEHGGEHIRQALTSQRVALLFGSEKVGLSNDELSHCQWLMHIPTREQHPSMNLGQAVAVCLYELSRMDPGGTGKSASGFIPDSKPASAGDLERLTSALLETLIASGYITASPSELAEEKVRRLIYRLNLQAKDSELLLGMVRQILWKVRS
jgi:tRNA/rRNA methyltransferase